MKCPPLPTETYGKSKKQDTPTEEKPAEKLLQANRVAFPDVVGNQFAFFNTHVKPGIEI